MTTTSNIPATKPLSTTNNAINFSDDQIEVTDNFVVISSRFHVIRHINTVSTHVIEPNFFFGLVLGGAIGLVLGLLLSVAATLVLGRSTNDIMVVIILVSAVICAFIVAFRQRPGYALQIKLSSGEVANIQSKEEGYIQKVKEVVLNTIAKASIS